MELKLNTIYKRLPQGKNKTTLFFQWLGYSLNGLQMFLIWSDRDPKKESITLTNNNINKLVKV